MIFLDYHYNITDEQIQDIIDPIFNYIKDEDKTLASKRSIEYAIPLQIAGIEKDDVILDIGCATSYIFLYLAKYVKLSYGIDDIKHGGYYKFTHNWIKSLIHYDEYIDGRANFINMNARELPFRDNYFTKIFTFSAFEHFNNYDDVQCVREIRRCLVPGGLFVGCVDYNADTEYPQADFPEHRYYTYDTFINRILIPSGLDLVGNDHIRYEKVNMNGNVQFPLFFALRKLLP